MIAYPEGASFPEGIKAVLFGQILFRFDTHSILVVELELTPERPCFYQYTPRGIHDMSNTLTTLAGKVTSSGEVLMQHYDGESCLILPKGQQNMILAGTPKAIADLGRQKWKVLRTFLECITEVEAFALMGKRRLSPANPRSALHWWWKLTHPATGQSG